MQNLGYEQNPILRGQGKDDLLYRFKNMLKEQLAKMNDLFMEKIWAGGPNDSKPDVSYFENIIAEGSSESGTFH
jgi:hypothetical protein